MSVNEPPGPPAQPSPQQPQQPQPPSKTQSPAPEHAAQPAPAPAYAAAPPQPYPAPAYPAPGYPAQPYPAHALPGHPAGPYPGLPYGVPLSGGDVLRSPRGLAVAVTAMLSVAGAVNLFAAGIGAYLFSLMTSVIADPAAVGDHALRQGDDLTTVASVLQNLIMVATAVVFVVWFHRVRVNGEIFRPDAFSQTRGWAVGAWFIPIGNLFLPFRTAKEIWTASTQFAPDGSFRQVSNAPVNAWWALWVGSLVLDRIFSRLYQQAGTPQALRDASAVGVASGLCTVAAAVFAIVFVRRLTALQTVKAAQGPNAAV
ncbi:DUF4328 domain-containing protein [Streptomyces sp. NBC_01205]|uniref:DUF4328 domain-containing protein n=1 Tax=Streptomyces sp. NBC_01205 TaxID=2903771 RepID=UPI002E117224|nr:DUF4328 domain-containing protein [Streptomyces sp. NBC_01205]